MRREHAQIADAPPLCPHPRRAVAAPARADGGESDSSSLSWFLFAGFFVVAWIASYVYFRQRRARERRVELAATVAAEDDPAFAPGAVRERARELYREVQDARDRGDRAALAELLAPGLFGEWRHRLDELDRKGWRHFVELQELKSVEYLGLVNREGESEDRLTVRISAMLLDYVVMSTGELATAEDSDRDVVEVAEFWTLAKCADGRGWVLAAIEEDAEGKHALGAEIVASPWGDDQRLADASRLEVAALERLPEQVSAADVVDLDYLDEARTAALDLSLVDGRWAPDVIEASVRRAVAAWAAAVDGAHGDLLDVATAQAAHALLHPGDLTGRSRLVVRGPRVRHLTITTLEPATEPPWIEVEVEVTGRRYVEDRETAEVLSGIKTSTTTTVERWTLALSGPDERPWQIVQATSGAFPRTLSGRVNRTVGEIRKAFGAFARAADDFDDAMR